MFTHAAARFVRRLRGPAHLAGQSWHPQSDPVPGLNDPMLAALAEGQRHFGRFLLLRVAGASAHGVVWVARDEADARQVALKFLPDLLARDEAVRTALKTTIERARILPDEVFVRARELHEDGPRAAISTALLEGNALGALREVRLNGCLDAAELLAWLEPFGAAFAAAPFAHGALHPWHLVLTPEGKVKVLDFAVAHLLTEAAERHGVRDAPQENRAFPYTSPQVHRGATATRSDDVYALGATIYDLLAGAPPYSPEQLGAPQPLNAPLPIRECRTARDCWGAPIPPAWEETIASSLSNEPSTRPDSIAALLESLRGGLIGHERKPLSRLGAVAELPASAVEPPASRADGLTFRVHLPPAPAKPASRIAETLPTNEPAEPTLLASGGVAHAASMQSPAVLQNTPLGLSRPAKIESSGSTVMEPREEPANAPSGAAGRLPKPGVPGDIAADQAPAQNRSVAGDVPPLAETPRDAPAGTELQPANTAAEHLAPQEERTILATKQPTLLNRQPTPVSNPRAGPAIPPTVTASDSTASTKSSEQPLLTDAAPIAKIEPAQIAAEDPPHHARLTPAWSAPAGAITATLPEVDAARALARQRAHHRAALLALAFFGVLVQAARMVSEHVLPPVLPETHRTATAQPGAAATPALSSAPQNLEPAPDRENDIPFPLPASANPALADPPLPRVEDGRAASLLPEATSVDVPGKPQEPSAAPSPVLSAPASLRAEPVPSSQPPKRGQRWINSLGMPFAPVPKLPVLVAIWETRVRDYEAFAKASKTTWRFPGAEREHPVVNVSYLDATRFCEWLTKAEFAAGRLKPGQHYRLPTDLEWSAAAGVAHETGVTLRERDDPHDELFSWGAQWPPPPSAGNFRGVNANSIDAGVLAGASDAYELSAPVGSFLPNRFGIFDLSGNAAEMVSDLIAPELGLHATRGASFDDAGQRALRLRARGVGENDRRGAPHIGFRIVLDPASTP